VCLQAYNLRIAGMSNLTFSEFSSLEDINRPNFWLLALVHETLLSNSATHFRQRSVAKHSHAFKFFHGLKSLTAKAAEWTKVIKDHRDIRGFFT